MNPPLPEQERLLDLPAHEEEPDVSAEEDFALSMSLDEDPDFDVAAIDLSELDAAVDPAQAEPPRRVDLRAAEAALEAQVDVPVPPRPESADRMLRLAEAGRAMRTGIREEIQAAANSIFALAVEQVRSELDAEVRRFEADMRRDVEAIREELRTRTAEEGFSAMEVERRLGEIAEAVAEVRDAVRGLRKRYLPGGQADPQAQAGPPA